jgi:3-isopropylmalate/(R)-2-methylmalate dehydratase small subunit
VVTFSVDGTKRNNLLNGLDDIGITMQSADKIGTFEAKQRREQPWLY